VNPITWLLNQTERISIKASRRANVSAVAAADAAKGMAQTKPEDVVAVIADARRVERSAAVPAGSDRALDVALPARLEGGGPTVFPFDPGREPSATMVPRLNFSVNTALNSGDRRP
jgi:hypothetical protein